MKTHPAHHAAALGYLGPAGDHNTNPIEAVPVLLHAVAEATGRTPRLFGEAFAVKTQSSARHLQDARPAMTAYADAVTAGLEAGHGIICVNGRCATSLATIPRVLAQHPDTVVVWLDAHADLNIPGRSETDYLGGMAISGPLGWWDSGLGAGLTPQQVVLVGTRAIDTAEQKLIEEHQIHVLAPHHATGPALAEIVASKPVYFHLDCDVLEPGTFRTDYTEPDGLTLDQLGDIAHALARTSTIVGVEIAEWEGPGQHQAADLVRAVAPLLNAVSG